MEELIYSIDKTRSEHDDALAIKIQVARRVGFTLEPLENQPSLTQDFLLKFSSPRDTNLIAFLIKEESLFLKSQKKSIDRAKTLLNITHILRTSIPEALKLLAITGKLYFEGKSLAIDLHSPVKFHYHADNNGVIGILQSASQELPIASCDFIGRGPPHFFVQGIHLKCIATEISWKDLKSAYEKKIRPLKELIEEANEDSDAPRVIGMDNKNPVVSEPLPLLILKDRLGSFADLHMDYGDGTIIDINDLMLHKKSRDQKAESGWEKDLLETDFIKKPVGTSYYHCPLDKVAKSIAFLLEIGWRVHDCRGNRVLLQQKTDLQVEAHGDIIQIKGKVHYDSFAANLSDIVGAFNRRERFAEIAPGHVALLPHSWEKSGLEGIVEAGEIVGDTVQLKKNQFGSLSNLFASQPALRCNEGMAQLKERLQGFQGVIVTALPDAFKGQLRPYQQQAVDWLAFLHDFGFHGLLADDMGLGKTVEAIAFLSTLKLQHPILIVMPTSLLFNWKKELERFLPSMPITVHHGNQRDLSDKPQIILTTYTTLRLDIALFSAIKYACVILDEAQAIKNSRTQTFQAVTKLDATFRLSITGTPVENNLMELWSHFRFLMPDLLGEEKEYQAEMQAGMSDPRFLRRIQKQIRPFMLRRRKEEVAKDLPEKIEQTVWVEMDDAQRTVYESFLTGVRKNLLEKVNVDGVAKHRIEILEAIMRLRQICCHPFLVGNEETSESAKLDALMQDIETAVAEGRKILVYSQFTSMLAIITKRVQAAGWKWVYLDGSTRDREKVVADFQNNANIPLFLISLKAGGIGLNLTAADYVFLYDPWWNNAVENQAIDRAHRIGRKDTVIAKRYLTAESIEEKMMKLKEAKSALAEDLFDDDAAVSKLSADDLLFLLNP